MFDEIKYLELMIVSDHNTVWFIRILNKRKAKLTIFDIYYVLCNSHALICNIAVGHKGGQ